MRNLLIIMPTRSRPERLLGFLEACAATCEADPAIAVAVDDDDPAGADYQTVIADADLSTLILYRGERRSIGPWVNYIAMENIDGYQAMMVLGDDNIPTTPGWDRLLLETLAEMGGTGMVYPENGRRRDIPEHVMMSSDIIRTLGWFCQPRLRHFYVDNVWADLGRHADCLRFCPEVVVEHHHYSIHPDVPHDEVYQQAESHGSEDAWAYQSWRRTCMDDDVAAVKKLLRSQRKTTAGLRPT